MKELTCFGQAAAVEVPGRGWFLGALRPGLQLEGSRQRVLVYVSAGGGCRPHAPAHVGKHSRSENRSG